jgi:hypothetical protein
MEPVRGLPRLVKAKTSTHYLVVSRVACLFSEQRVLLRDFIGTRLQFSERMSEVASTRISPSSRRMVVVLPAPLGPINPAMVPVGTLMVSPSTAVRLPKCLRKPCVSMAKVPEALPGAEPVAGAVWDAWGRSGERDIGTSLRRPPI